MSVSQKIDPYLPIIGQAEEGLPIRFLIRLELARE